MSHTRSLQGCGSCRLEMDGCTPSGLRMPRLPSTGGGGWSRRTAPRANRNINNKNPMQPKRFPGVALDPLMIKGVPRHIPAAQRTTTTKRWIQSVFQFLGIEVFGTVSPGVRHVISTLAAFRVRALHKGPGKRASLHCYQWAWASAASSCFAPSPGGASAGLRGCLRHWVNGPCVSLSPASQRAWHR